MHIKNLFSLIIIQFLLLNICLADNIIPTYSDGTLTVPSVDTIEIPGLYQDLIFDINNQGQWLLLDGKLGEELPVESVEMIKTDTFPVQVFLKISGTLPSTCANNIGQIRYRSTENKLEAFIYYPDITHQLSLSNLHEVNF